jgi:hypothetical protein
MPRSTGLGITLMLALAATLAVAPAVLARTTQTVSARRVTKSDLGSIPAELRESVRPAIPSLRCAPSTSGAAHDRG